MRVGDHRTRGMSTRERDDRMTALPMLPRPWAASFTVTALVVLGIALILFLHRGSSASGRSFGDARRTFALEWSAAHPHRSDLYVISTEITFRGSPGGFVVGEGIVVAPLAMALDGVQDVLDVRAMPPPSRVMRVDGNVVVAWEYAGRIHRDMRYSAYALVRRPMAGQVTLPSAPRFASLERQALLDATATAREARGHGLDRCQELERWAFETAGAPPHTEQLLRIVRRAAAGIRDIDEKRSRAHDACASIREGAYSAHKAFVVAVMAARQVGIPAYGFISAAGRYYITTFVDGIGWATLDLTAVGSGFVRAPPGLVTRTPAIADFDAVYDDFWGLHAAAYREQWGSMRPISWTEWLTDTSNRPETDTTVTSSVPLAEARR
jgi:hypothetical protein